jgi:hypothetical protein
MNVVISVVQRTITSRRMGGPAMTMCVFLTASAAAGACNFLGNQDQIFQNFLAEENAACEKAGTHAVMLNTSYLCSAFGLFSFQSNKVSRLPGFFAAFRVAVFLPA